MQVIKNNPCKNLNFTELVAWKFKKCGIKLIFCVSWKMKEGLVFIFIPKTRSKKYDCDSVILFQNSKSTNQNQIPELYNAREKIKVGELHGWLLNPVITFKKQVLFQSWISYFWTLNRQIEIWKQISRLVSYQWRASNQ